MYAIRSYYELFLQEVNKAETADEQLLVMQDFFSRELEQELAASCRFKIAVTAKYNNFSIDIFFI